MKRVVINSLHSDSINYVKKANPETVISFDAHPDLGHWKNIEVVKSIMELEIPEKAKSGLFRASTQALLRASLPQARIVSVVPEACVITDFNWRLLQDGMSGIGTKRQTFTKYMAISTWKKKLARLSIEGRTVPPTSIVSLLPIAKGNPLVFDIDADYLYELTDYCQTSAGFSDTPVPTYGMPRDNLGSIQDVQRIISLAKPELVTLSEITYKCLKSKNRQWSHFLAQLERIGYDVEWGSIYTDVESKEILSINGDFWKFYSHRTNSKEPDDLLKAYLDFFSNKGVDNKSS
jgi:hypothetical protein